MLPRPWIPQLETRQGIGGCSFVQIGHPEESDREIYFDVRIGQQQLISPSAELDALVEFTGHAADDVPTLLAEIQRLNATASQYGMELGRAHEPHVHKA